MRELWDGQAWCFGPLQAQTVQNKVHAYAFRPTLRDSQAAIVSDRLRVQGPALWGLPNACAGQVPGLILSLAVPLAAAQAAALCCFTQAVQQSVKDTIRTLLEQPYGATSGE